jgi:hypothetical protein
MVINFTASKINKVINMDMECKSLMMVMFMKVNLSMINFMDSVNFIISKEKSTLEISSSIIKKVMESNRLKNTFTKEIGFKIRNLSMVKFILTMKNFTKEIFSKINILGLVILKLILLIFKENSKIIKSLDKEKKFILTDQNIKVNYYFYNLI